MYYWKTTFELDSTERAFLEEHNIKRLYVRMFDVALEPDYLNGSPEIVPIATTKFVSEIPAGVEIVPVAYITIDALRAMHGQESEYATLIVERLLAMASFNKCGDIREIQLDSDWTESTRNSYHSLCELVKSELSAHNIMLSLTIRLHQMRETPPPADRGVLMLYNTGALKDPNTHNSILSIEDVKPYLSEIEYPLPLDYAYPVYGWGVKFSDNKFVSIVTTEDVQIKENEHIRYERPQVSEIVEVKELVEKSFGKPVSGNILYHLDSKQLKNYTSDEIDKILTY
ncbi:MAG: hypothetical protein J6U91_03720 [Alistipes sp.]|nr:hypothetical protein [Alistipes sp.]